VGPKPWVEDNTDNLSHSTSRHRISIYTARQFKVRSTATRFWVNLRCRDVSSTFEVQITDAFDASGYSPPILNDLLFDDPRDGFIIAPPGYYYEVAHNFSIVSLLCVLLSLSANASLQL
jgi:hypothetical protein